MIEDEYALINKISDDSTIRQETGVSWKVKELQGWALLQSQHICLQNKPCGDCDVTELEHYHWLVLYL